MSDDCVEYCNRFLNLLKEFQFTWDGHLGERSTAKHRIELKGENTDSIHSAPYRAKPKFKKFRKIKIDAMLLQRVTERAQTKWAAPIVTVSTKDELLLFLRRI